MLRCANFETTGETGPSLQVQEDRPEGRRAAVRCALRRFPICSKKPRGPVHPRAGGEQDARGLELSRFNAAPSAHLSATAAYTPPFKRRALLRVPCAPHPCGIPPSVSFA